LRKKTILKNKTLLTLIIIILLVVSSIAFILGFQGRSGTQFWIAVTSAHGSPTPSAWVDNDTDFTASVTSPTETVANDHQWVCTGFSVDGGAYISGTSHTFTNVEAAHTISFSWKEQFWIAVTSAHGSPTPSAWVDNDTDFTASVTSPTEAVANDRQWICTGYGVDGGASVSGTSYTFTSVTAKHSIDFSWQARAKIVGKQIPPGYVMGDLIDGGLMNGMNVLFINSPTERVSIRFTAQLSGEVTALSIFEQAQEGQPRIRVGLQQDNAGLPKGEWMNQNGFGISQATSNFGFLTVNLQTPVSISKGSIYHVVIEAVDNPLNGTIMVMTYMGKGSGQPLNEEDPDIVWPDTTMNTLSYDGEKWQEENKWPIFVLTYSDGRFEGQPYSLSAQWVVYASTYVGQTIIPASNYTIGKIAFLVGLNGTPKDKLYYEVRDSSNNVLTNGIFAEASQLTAQRTWIEAALPSPVTLSAGQLYKIVLLSSGTDLGNPYYVFGHEFSYDPSIGYGGLQHQLTSSLDAGSVWADNKDADAIFKLTTTQ
jgi:hypothetical protein